MKKFLILIFFLYNCSFDNRSGIWTDEKKIIKESDNQKIVFKKRKILNEEINTQVKIKLKSKLKNSSNYDENTNNVSRVNFDNDIVNKSKFKFSKIDNFDYFEPELVFHKDHFIFFDDKGSIIKFDKNSKIVWKTNIYTKQEKKQKPLLNFAISKNILIIADNITNYYAINLNDGNVLWSQNSQNPFNSQIKISENRFFLVDLNNILRSFSMIDGTELWKFKTENNFLKSDKRNSIVIIDKVIYFNNSLGDISAVDVSDGSLIWQTPTQTSSIYESSFSLISSDLVSNRKNLFFSNNRNEFYSLNLETGFINWKRNINSSVRPVLINELIFTISNEGYLFVIESETGKILRTTDIFDLFKSKKRSKIKPIGFIVGVNKIYLTTNHGRLLTIDILSGKTMSVLKIDNNKISRPFVSNKKLFVVQDNSIIRLN